MKRTVGFFTRADAKGSGRRKRELPAARLWELGIRGVDAMNPDAEFPHLPPVGPETGVALYVLGSAPAGPDDAKGAPFAGKPGAYLRRVLPREIRDLTRYNYVCRTRPPKDREPLRDEIECYRPSLIADIERAKPAAILAVGKVATEWALRVRAAEKVMRGRRCAARIGTHECYVFPILDPAWILRVRDGRDEDIQGDAWEAWFARDVRAAAECALRGESPSVFPTDRAALSRYVSTIHGPTVGASTLVELERISALDGPVTIDVETNCLRPYTAGAKLLSVAVSVGDQVVAFPWDHPGRSMPRAYRQRVKDALRALLAREVRAQNASMEMEWLAWLYDDPSIMREPSRWVDTMVAGFFLDERPGGNNLNVLTAQWLGVAVKSITGVDAKNAEDEEISALLWYNALDTLFTHWLADRLLAELDARGLRDAYEECGARRVPTVTLAQWYGIPVDAAQQAEFERDYAKRIEAATDALMRSAGVREFERKHGSFNPASSDACIKLFRDVLGRPEGAEGKVGAKGYSTAEPALSAMADCDEARLVLELRRLLKLRGTYIEPMRLGHRKGLVYPDGKLHTSFSVARARSGRLASSEPNNQNWPKRKDREIRKMIAAPPGHHIVSIDYGQIEARVLAMASRDPRWSAMLWHGYDVHMEWAEKIARVHKRALDRLEGNMKALRSAVKNQMVFPAFYGASARSIAGYLDVPERKVERLFAEFWDTFSGIKSWQKKTARFYEKNGYVECLSGRRSHGPLSYNMILNRPIQGAASDIVVNAMDRISECATETGRPWIQPVLNIHDDLTFIIPDRELEDALAEISGMMVSVPYEWAKCVPITAEIEIGKNWHEMEPVCVVTSEDSADE